MDTLADMDKPTLIKKFNSIISNLLDQVSSLIGTKYSGYFNKLIKVNAILPIKNFIVHAIPHERKILDRDPDYFMDESVYKKEVRRKWGENVDWYLNEILNLKTVYLSVDDESKENLWDTVTVLLLMSKKYQTY